MPRLPLPPRQKMVRPRHRAGHVDPYFGYGYNPSWPSILSVAHDESNGARLFVILDRPCVLGAGPLCLPLIVPDGGAPLAVVSAEMVLPVKMFVTLSDAVPVHSPWRWSGGVCSLTDPITGNYPNAGSGDCADSPGPYVAPANVVSVLGVPGGTTCAMQFDRAVTLVPGATPDDAMRFGDVPALAVWQIGPETLGFEIGVPVDPGVTPWTIDHQPDWILAPLVNPVGDVIGGA